MSSSRKNLPESYFDAKFDGDSHVEEGNFAKARLELEKALGTLEEFHSQERAFLLERIQAARQGLMESKLKDAEEAFQDDKPELGQSCLDEAFDLAPDSSARDQVRQAMLRHAPGEDGQDLPPTARLQKLYERTLDLPDEIGPAYDFAVELALDGFLDAAAHQFEKVLELAEDDESKATVHFRLANVLRDLEQLEDARQNFEDALAKGYDPADVHYRLGEILDWKGDHEAAREKYQACLEEKSDHLSALEALALSYEADEEPEKAIEVYGRITAVDPEDAQSFFRIGSLYLDLENPEKASEAFEKSIAAEPESDFAELSRQELQALSGHS